MSKSGVFRSFLKSDKTAKNGQNLASQPPMVELQKIVAVLVNFCVFGVLSEMVTP